jgi:hypothetical protein
MNNIDFMFLIIIFITIVLVYYFIEFDNMIYIKSDIDNQMYLVRNTSNRKKAADMLAQLKKNIFILTEIMYEKTQKLPTKRYIEFAPYILQLKENIYNVVIRESSENSVYTSYTINKGKEIVFCIRSKDIACDIRDNKNKCIKLHDINLIMYVALHEISHVACPELQHTELFKRIFKFICEEAIEAGLYRRIDFSKNHHECCGIQITDSII